MDSISHNEPGTFIDRNLIALAVRQPWAELILRGLKTIEVRSQNTRRRGPILIYAGRKLADVPAARIAADKHQIDPGELPLGLLVGTVEISATRICTRRDSRDACVPPELLKNRFAWELTRAERFDEPQKVHFLPYGIWFYPYQRRNRRR